MRFLCKCNNVTEEAKLAGVKRRFAATFTTMLALFDELHSMEAFWRPYVTVDFLGYIGMECYLIHGFLVDPSALELGQRNFFLFFAVEILGIILLLTGECSLVVHNSDRYYQLNRKFIYELSQRKGGSKAMSLATMLKLDALVANYKGTRLGFKLINNQLIDSKMFELLFFYLSTMFMKAF